MGQGMILLQSSLHALEEQDPERFTASHCDGELLATK